MIELYQFPPIWDQTSPSPPCAKVETYLRMTGQAYKSVYLEDPRKMPKSKLPVIKDGGRTIADSSFILAYLKETYGDPLDAHLTADEMAMGHAFQRLLEENLYWCVVYSRWADPRNWPRTKAGFFDEWPFPMRALIPIVASRITLRNLHGQGMGQHSVAEVDEIAIRDLTAVANHLGDSSYFMGDQPTSFDAVLYPYVAYLMRDPAESGFRDFGRDQANLAAYHERMSAKYFA